MFGAMWLLLAVLIAAVAVVIIHSLFRRARKRLTVATLKPFDATTSPRWQWIQPDHWWLLLLRVSIFGLLLWLVLSPPQLLERSTLGGKIIVVSPDAPLATWRTLRDQADHAFWLDDFATPLSDAAPQSTTLPVTVALMQIDQRRSRDSSMTVVGPIQSAAWPELRPLLKPDVIFLAGERQRPATTDAVVEQPSGIVVITPDGEQRELTLAAIDRWRSAGLLDDGVTVETFERLPADLSANVRWWIVDDQQTVELVRQQDSSAHVALISAAARNPSVGELATDLWYQFGAELGLGPSATAVLPNPVSISSLPNTRIRMPSGQKDALPQMWLLFLLGLFMFERLLSLRQGSR